MGASTWRKLAWAFFYIVFSPHELNNMYNYALEAMRVKSNAVDEGYNILLVDVCC